MGTDMTLEALFDRFVEAHERGEPLDVPALLDHAGAEGDALGRLIDAYLRAAPVRPPDEETVVLMQARLAGEPALLVLRQRRKLSAGAVVDALVTKLGLDVGKRDKVDRYYHALEVGRLDPQGVDRSVWDVLRGVFSANARALVDFRPPQPVRAEGLFQRVADIRSSAVAPEVMHALHDRDVAVEDEIDRLFTSGS